jgi:DNA-binding FadR family transcriptional regulator
MNDNPNHISNKIRRLIPVAERRRLIEAEAIRLAKRKLTLADYENLLAISRERLVPLFIPKACMEVWDKSSELDFGVRR